MSLDPHFIIKTPVVTEESQIQIGKARNPQYTFKVDPKANKVQIRAAIEAVFPEVKVIRVNTMNYDGKIRRGFATRRTGRKAHWKKAVVTLRPGDKIELI